MSVAIEQLGAVPELNATPRGCARVEFGRMVEQHGVWLASDGERGKQAETSGARLDGIDLTDARLQFAVLNKAVLNGADLLLADFRDASLLQADLRGANLLGT